jgi:hypothetical protein
MVVFKPEKLRLPRKAGNFTQLACPEGGICALFLYKMTGQDVIFNIMVPNCLLPNRLFLQQ